MDLITVYTSNQLHEIYLIHGFLESHDVEALIVDENIVGSDWLLGNAVGGASNQKCR